MEKCGRTSYYQPLQLIKINKTEDLKGQDIFNKFFIDSTILETDYLSKEELIELIPLLRADEIYKKKKLELDGLEKRLKELNVKENIFSESIANAIKSKFAEIKWPNGMEKPNIKIVSKEEILTMAKYDAKTNTILVLESLDQVKQWDSILFEAMNALNSDSFKKKSAGSRGGSEKTLREYGFDMASVEYNSFERYVIAVKELIDKGLSKAKLPQQAQKSLKEYDDVYSKLGDDDRKKKFAETPHEVGAEGTAGLPSRDMYAYEAVENFGDNTSATSRIRTYIKRIIKEIEPKNLYVDMEPIKSINNFIIKKGENWPDDNHRKKRPYAFHSILSDLDNEIGELIKNKEYESKKASLGVLQKKLKDLDLSTEALAIAIQNK